MNWCRFIFIQLLMVLWVGSALAADHYIRAGAAGSGNGSDWANAWPTFSAVTWTRGDTYYVAAGTYSENVSIARAESGALYIYVRKATAAAHGMDVGWSGSYAEGQAEIDGTLYIGSSYIEVDGVTGSESSGHGILVHYSGCNPTVFNTGASVVQLTGGKNSIHLRHLEVAGCGFGTYASTDGIYQNNFNAPAADIQVSSCWVHDVSRNGMTLLNHQGTAFSDGRLGFLFENSRLERTGGCTYPDWHGQGVQVGAGSTQNYMVFRNNQFVDVLGTGYIAFLGNTINNNIRIYNNIFHSTDRAKFEMSPGVITFLAAPATFVNNVQIFNNTFYNLNIKGVTNVCAFAGAPACAMPLGTNNYLKNNIFANSAFTYGNVGFTSENNDYYNNTYNTSVVWRYYNELGYQTESADPFVDSAGRDFHLKATAGAKDKGANLSGIFSADRDGTSRPQGPDWDIGAYEYYLGQPSNRPRAPMNLLIR